MVAKTRRGARKGRSTRRSKRAAKRGGFLGMCSRAKPKTLREYVDCGKAMTIYELKDLITKGWTVNTNNKTATCRGVTAKLGPIEEGGKKYWAYPTTSCSDTFDQTLIEKAASWRIDNNHFTDKSPQWPKHPDHPEGRVLAV